MLQSILEKGMVWHASLLQSLIKYDTRPGVEHARQMSDLEQTAWRRKKREAYLQAKHAFSEGKRLAEERDSKKMTYFDMSAREQQLVEDFDTKELKKHVDEKSLRVDRTPFRGSLQG